MEKPWFEPFLQDKNKGVSFFELPASAVFSSRRLFQKWMEREDPKTISESLHQIPQSWAHHLFQNPLLFAQLHSILESVQPGQSFEFWKNNTDGLEDPRLFFNHLQIYHAGLLPEHVGVALYNRGADILLNTGNNLVHDTPGMEWLRQVVDLSNDLKEKGIDHDASRAVALATLSARRYNGYSSGREEYDFSTLTAEYPWVATHSLLEQLKTNRDYKNADAVRKNMGIPHGIWAQHLHDILMTEIQDRRGFSRNDFYEYLREVPDEELVQWNHLLLDKLQPMHSMYANKEIFDDYKNDRHREHERYQSVLHSLLTRCSICPEAMHQLEDRIRPETNPLMEPDRFIGQIIKNHRPTEFEVRPVFEQRCQSLFIEYYGSIPKVDGQGNTMDYCRHQKSIGNDISWLGTVLEKIMKEWCQREISKDNSFMSNYFIRDLNESRSFDKITEWVAILDNEDRKKLMPMFVAILEHNQKGFCRRADKKDWDMVAGRILKETNPDIYKKSMSRDWSYRDKVMLLMTGDPTIMDTWKTICHAIGKPETLQENINLLSGLVRDRAPSENKELEIDHGSTFDL